MTTKLRSLLRWCISRADSNPNGYLCRSAFLPRFTYSLKGNLQVALDIRAQGFYRRNIEDTGNVLLFVRGRRRVLFFTFAK